MRSSLAARLIVPLTLSAGLIIALGLLLDYRLMRAGIVREIEAGAREGLAAAETFVDGLASALARAAAPPALRAGPGPDFRPRIEATLSALVRDDPRVIGAAFAIDPGLMPAETGYGTYFFRRGDRVGRLRLDADGVPYWTRDWFIAARSAGRALWAEPVYGAGGAEPLRTTFTTPVYGGDNFLGVLTADISLVELSRRLAAIDLGEHGFAFVLDRDGRLVGAPAPTFAGQAAAQGLLAGEDAPWAALLARTLAGETVTAPVRCLGMSGRCRLQLQRLASTGWTLGAVYSEAEALAPLRNYETRVATVGLAMLLLIILTVTVVTRRLTRPIEELARVSRAVARGHLGVELPAVRGDDEISQLVRAFDAMRRDLGDYIGDLADATASRSRLEGELTAARDIQLSMLPQQGNALLRRQHAALWARVRPARSVGGDLYSFHVQENKLLFAVGDVSDKGVPAALFMARAISLIQQWEVQPGVVPPAAALHQLNAVLQADNPNCMFLTLCLGVLDLRTLALEVATAGHPPPVLIDGQGARPLALDGGPALGLEAAARFAGQALTLIPGQRLAVYTDGLDEAFNPAGRMLGSEALLDIFAAVGQAPLKDAGERALAAVDAFAEDTPQADDMTLLLLDALDGGRVRQTRVDAGPALARRALAWLRGELESLGLDPEANHDLTLALEEIVTNIAKYAGLAEGQDIGIALCLRDRLAELAVRDPGSPFNPLEDARRARLGASTAAAEVGGLGIHLLIGITDEQHYRHEQGHNVLSVVRYL